MVVGLLESAARAALCLNHGGDLGTAAKRADDKAPKRAKSAGAQCACDGGLLPIVGSPGPPTKDKATKQKP